MSDAEYGLLKHESIAGFTTIEVAAMIRRYLARRRPRVACMYCGACGACGASSALYPICDPCWRSSAPDAGWP